jgi:anaerobic magnesium-protoporphyrin IX monomethyl ester cyclase
MKMKEHIALIFTPIDKRYKDALTHYAPPLGLIALANYIQEKLPNVKISILDGSVSHSMDDIIDFIEKEKPNIVGQSIQHISYENALQIAKYVHSIGAINVFGGQHATQMADAIVLNQKGLVDYVSVEDGEESLLGLIMEKPLNDIPNLVFLKNGSINRTDYFQLNLNNSPKLDYSIVEFEPYQALLKDTKFINSNPISNYLRIYSHKGCGNRENSVGCVFCGRADKGVRFKSPEQFWEDIQIAVDKFKADYIFDVGDDFLYNHEWVSKVTKTKPYILNKFQLGIFARANRVNSQIALNLKEIGITDVVIGFESGDEKVLSLCNKRNTSPEINISAANALATAGIDITASFVLGLPGENALSLKKTVDCAEKIVQLITKKLGRPPREMVGNLIEPSPGSIAYKKLVKAYPKKYYLKDNIQLEEMQRDYFKYYFGLSSFNSYLKFRKELNKAAQEIHSFVGFCDPQGWLNTENIHTKTKSIC